MAIGCSAGQNPLVDEELVAVAVKRIVVHPVVDDEQVPVTLEIVGVDTFRMDGMDDDVVLGRSDFRSRCSSSGC